MQKLNTLWLALGVTILGIVLGLLLASPLTNLTVSIIGVSTYLLAIFANPVSGLLLWVVTNPFGDLYINIPLGASIPDLSPARFCVAFISVLLLAQVAIRKRDLASFNITDITAIIFVIGLGFSVVNDDSSWQETLQNIFDRYYVPLFVYFFAKNLVTQRRDMDKVLRAVLFFGIYASLYAIYEIQTGNILFFDGKAESLAFIAYQDSGLHVLRGLLNRSDHFGALFSMVIPINFYLLLNERVPAKKGLYALTLILLFLGIFFTYKRTAWMAILVSFFVMQWFYPKFRRVFFVLLLVFVVVLGATWNTISQSVIVTDRINSQSSTAADRTDGWNAAIDLWAQQPLFGYGLGNYTVVAEKEGVDDTALESEHLGILFGTGLVGFVPYIALLTLILWDSIRLYRGSRQSDGGELKIDRDSIVVFWGVFLGYIINYWTTTANVFSITIVFYLLVGTLVGSQLRYLEPLSQKMQRRVSSQSRGLPGVRRLT